VFGAGAIGSLFGAYLSKTQEVALVARKPHADAIKNKGLTVIEANKKFNFNPKAVCSIEEIDFLPDLVILTVKSYDTLNAIKEIKKNIGRKTIILSLQNGLDNVEKIKTELGKDENIIAGVTMHGVTFLEPGVIDHTGIGETIIGELDGRLTNRIEEIATIFDKCGLSTKVSDNIFSVIWEKAIINSAVNPLTTLFQCRNGYLLENPFLEKLLDEICKESTNIARSIGIKLPSTEDIIKNVKRVVKNTARNYSSMLQSIKHGKKTEIDSINGFIVRVAKEKNLPCLFNSLLFRLIRDIETSL
jgi:2-dehydropantoate 2-reductase